ncbi:MAG: hypothetical protein ACI4II_08290 [Acutalibacteraceae bacterium]
MKYAILQIARSFICLTPVTTEKLRSGKPKNKKGIFGAANDAARFGATRLFELPDQLYGSPLAKPKEFTEFLLDCAQKMNLELKELIFCPEGDELISKEYQHMPTKKKYLNSFAVLETEPMVSDDVSNYSVISCEYGEEYGKAEDSGMLNAVLYAMKNTYINDFKSALFESGVKLTRITPPTIALINAAKNENVAFDKTVAFISADYVGIRVVVVNHNVPIYSQYLSSPVADIAEMYARDKRIGIIEAINAIKSGGIGASKNCFPKTTEQIDETLDNAISEVARNLRMVLLSQRLELDQIYISDTFATIPGLLDYSKEFNLTEHISLINDLYTNASGNVPLLESNAEDVGFSNTSFYLFNSMITYCTGMDDNMLYGIGTTSKRNVNIGKYICYAASAAIVVYMGIFFALNLSMNLTAKHDQEKLNDVRFNKVKEYIDEELKLSADIANAENDLELLPNSSHMYLTLDRLTDMITSNGGTANSYSISNSKNVIEVTFTVSSYNQFTKLVQVFNDCDEFELLVEMSASPNRDDGSYSCKISLSVNEDVFNEYLRKQQELEEAAQQNSSNTASSESSSTASSESTDDSTNSSDGGNE